MERGDGEGSGFEEGFRADLETDNHFASFLVDLAYLGLGKNYLSSYSGDIDVAAIL